MSIRTCPITMMATSTNIQLRSICMSINMMTTITSMNISAVTKGKP